MLHGASIFTYKTGMIIPNIWEKKNMFQTTNQICVSPTLDTRVGGVKGQVWLSMKSWDFLTRSQPLVDQGVDKRTVRDITHRIHVWYIC